MINAFANTHLGLMMQGNNALLTELIDHFVGHTPALIHHLEKALIARDLQAIFGISERLNSSFRLMNVTDAMELLGALKPDVILGMSKADCTEVSDRLLRFVAAFE
mgnify:CR=1 FL=1|tara:strand:+ start:308 stop:625 length:318 start_codon:yes stop_codon:yes gene_type:complete